MKSIFGKSFSFEGAGFFVKIIPTSLKETPQEIKIYGEIVLQKWGRISVPGYLWFDLENRKAAIIRTDELEVFQEDGLALFADLILDEHQRFLEIINYDPPKQYTYRALPFHGGKPIKRFNSNKEYKAYWIEAPSGKVIVEAALMGTSTLVFETYQVFQRLTGNGRFIGILCQKNPAVKKYKHNRRTHEVHPDVRRELGELYKE